MLQSSSVLRCFIPSTSSRLLCELIFTDPGVMEDLAQVVIEHREHDGQLAEIGQWVMVLDDVDKEYDGEPDSDADTDIVLS
jgi:hypothetical protein